MKPDTKRICTINARGGSKGVPGKNLTLIAGVPLLGHSILQAQESQLFDCIAVSSDSGAILEVARNLGALGIERPSYLATDSAPKIPAIIHCLEQAEGMTGVSFNTIVDLDATSPLRVAADVTNVVEILESGGVRNVFTASASRRSPYFNQVAQDSQGKWGPVVRLSEQIVRRQDSPATYDMNASIYAWERDALVSGKSVFLESTAMYLMPEERSWDIDSAFDLQVVRHLLEKRLNWTG